VIDDNEMLSGRTVLGVPIVTGAEFFAQAEAVASAFVMICIQKKAAYEKISQSLIRRGVAREHIVHRMF
jgi:hypothetical protein